MKMEKGWEIGITADFRDTTPFNIFRTFFLERSIKLGVPLYVEHISGYTTEDMFSYLEKTYEAPLLQLVFMDEDMDLNVTNKFGLYTINGEEGVLDISDSDNYFYGTVMSPSKATCAFFCKKMREKLSDAPIKGTVHMLAFEKGYRLIELGEVDQPLERGNYAGNILEQYDHVVADLGTATPFGRLTLLDGVPGTGKSFMIRGLISAVKGLFIYVPASIAGRLTGPDIIPVLMSKKDKDVPIILIIEDADSSLTTRQLDNVSRLSDLLNMSDGLFGDMADIRIIATTNSPKSDIDKAVLRPGRLNEHMQFEALSTDHATQVFERLIGLANTKKGISKNFPDKLVLAEIYKEAWKHGWKPSPRVRKISKNFKNHSCGEDW